MKAKVRMKFKGNLKLSVRRVRVLLAEQVLFKLLLIKEFPRSLSSDSRTILNKNICFNMGSLVLQYMKGIVLLVIPLCI